jgi:hypothetical protein
MGAMGVIALLVLCFTGMHQGGAIRRLARTDADRELGQAYLATAVVTLVISATFDALSFPMFAGIFFLTLGTGASHLGFLRREHAAEQASAQQPGPEALAAEESVSEPAPVLETTP